MLRSGIPVLIALLMIPTVGRTEAYGQSEASEAKVPRKALANGVEAIRSGESDRGVRLLQDIVLDTLAYVDQELGAGAYWLGKAYADRGEVQRALRVWRSGLLALGSQAQFRIRLADSFIHHVYLHKVDKYYSFGAELYRELLNQLGHEVGEAGASRLVQRLRHLSLVLPTDARRRIGMPEHDRDITSGILRSIDGEEVLTWWRAQDPLPATQENEQIREHLHRVAYAQEHYSHPETLYGFDDRGQIYVRLGKPDHEVRVDFDETRLVDMLTEVEVGVDVDFSDFPKNAFWSYGWYDRRIYYIFAEEDRGGPLRIGTTEDLLPERLKGPFGASERSRERSMYALAALRAIYRQYSPFHPDLAARHDKIANYLSLAERGGLEQFSGANYRSPSTFTTKTLQETRNEDLIASRQREESVPNQLSSSRREMPQLGIAARVARFLNENGTTRTEVYWAPERGGLILSEDQRESYRERGYDHFKNYLLRFTAAQKTSEYRDRIVSQNHYRVQDIEGTEVTIPARTFATPRGDSALYHLSMQWDQYLLSPDADSIGPNVKRTTLQKDSLRPLTPDSGVLEMSDPKLLLASGEQGRLEDAVPYPFQEVTPERPLALYFEVYHLLFDDQDRTEYTVEYEMYRRTDEGALVELIRGDEEERTTVSSTYRGDSRRTEEYILLDLNRWEIERNIEVTVTVRVTDELTGQEVERTVDFRVLPPEE